MGVVALCLDRWRYELNWKALSEFWCLASICQIAITCKVIDMEVFTTIGTNWQFRYQILKNTNRQSAIGRALKFLSDRTRIFFTEAMDQNKFCSAITCDNYPAVLCKEKLGFFNGEKSSVWDILGPMFVRVCEQ